MTRRTAVNRQVHEDAKKGHKRRLSETKATSDESGDSDDQYGWAEEDIQLAAEGLVDEENLGETESSPPHLQKLSGFKTAHKY